MKVYVLGDTESFLTFEDENSFGKFRRKFIGSPMLEEWEPISVEEFDPRDKKFDMSKLCSNPVLSENSIYILGKILKDNAEILPYLHKTENYYAINVTNMIDCVDLSKSEIVMDYEYNIVKEINRFVFIEEKIRNQTIFKIPQYKRTRVFVTDTFRDKVIEAKLTGFEFLEVWDSESSEVVNAVIENAENYGSTYSYVETEHLLKQGKTVASDKWVMQQQGDIIYLGERGRNGVYSWMAPYYIPPILLDLQWHVIERL